MLAIPFLRLAHRQDEAADGGGTSPSCPQAEISQLPCTVTEGGTLHSPARMCRYAARGKLIVPPCWHNRVSYCRLRGRLNAQKNERQLF